MLLFFRKIRQDLIVNNQIRKYLKYAIGEIVLVVLGILIAISLNNLKDAADRKKDELELYQDMITELSEDLRDIQENADYNNYFIQRYSLGAQIILTDKNRDHRDSLMVIASELTKFSDFKNERPIYDRLFTSGEQSLMSDSQLISDLKRLAVLYNYLNRLERNHQDYMYAVLPKIADYVRINPPEIMDLDSLYGYRFHNDIEILIYIMKEKNQVYSDVSKNISNLIDKLKGKLDE